MEGIRFITDESGKIVAVQIDLEVNASIWNEFQEFVEKKKAAAQQPQTDENKQKTLIMEKIEMLAKQAKLNQVITELDELTKS